MPTVLPAALVQALRHPTPEAADYTAMQFTPADSKAWFVAHFLRFASSDFPEHHFTDRFYRQVMNTFGYIYPAQARTRKFFGSMMRKLSVTSSQ